MALPPVDRPANRLANRLARETSPYLLQHAQNPVNWFAWGDEALEQARREDKPIMLSIGYSACHWCHVMAHESFDDVATAEVLNRDFINVKVDREERPDIDRIYQVAHQLLTHSGGGWPLTVFLDPHTQLPFFSGTYFPKQARYQLPAFVDVLRRINDVFCNRRAELAEQAEKLKSIFADLEPKLEAGAQIPGTKVLQRAREALSNSYDQSEGGFGEAPKFPMPTTIERALRHWAFSGRKDNRDSNGNKDREALDMAFSTLTKIARGGIFDHLGGGFFRYSTDRRWMIPHFEKMLYDNGPLLTLYADATAVSRDALFEGAVRDTAGWVMREMQHAEGGYFASLDADSEGHEGKYYVWRRQEVKQLLSEDEYLVIETLYGLDKPANFEGKWNLHRYDAWRAVMEQLSLEPDAANTLLAAGRAKLLDAREQRVHPDLDNKVITSWNGMMIKGMARAGMQLSEPEWIDSACRAADFVREQLWHDGRLSATWVEGQARHAGYLDDYANLLDGLLMLLQARWRDADLRFAIALADAVLEHFEDATNGGFFFTAHDHEELIYRPKPTTDEAMPPGNGVLARVLRTLGNLMSNERYVEAAERTLKWAAGQMQQAPAGLCSMLSALEDHIYAPELVLISGPADQLQAWQAATRTGYTPWRTSFCIGNDVRTIPPPLLPPYLPKVTSTGDRNRPVAYVCSGMSCSLPLRDVAALKQALAG